MNVYNLYRSVEGDENQILIHTENATNTTTTHEYVVEDHEIDSGVTYNYWLEAIGNDGSTSNFGPVSVTIDGEIPELPTNYQFGPAFPNPINLEYCNIPISITENKIGYLTII